MADDVRLSSEVEKIQEKNKEYVEEKSRMLAQWIKEYLNWHFENKYDEMFWFVLFVRKWNDVNTLVVNTLLWTWISTWADRSMLRDALYGLSWAIDTSETDLLDE